MRPRRRHITERVLHRGRWLTLRDLVYDGTDGSTVHWECIERRRTQDVVVVVARLVPSGRIVLARQYRAAVRNWVIGLPAGIVERCGVRQTALHELKEEAGYTGVIRRVSPPLLSNPAVLTDRVRLVLADVDEGAPANRNPRQALEPSEEIEVFTVAPSRVRQFLCRRAAAGDAISSGVWYLLAFWDTCAVNVPALRSRRARRPGRGPRHH